jgi:RNA polymerase sigma factor (sigma-70 family)
MTRDRVTWSRSAVADDPELSDGDLVRLARDGNSVAFRLLVERHQPAARARARRLCPNPSDVDDTVQDSFLQAFVALDRLREPDRFAGWLAGIVLNVCRGLYRREQLTLLPDWPEPLHPASAVGLPSADDLDRADALREAVADLPAGQRRAVALHYYADLPPGQIAEPPGAARASLHKARIRLRAYITEHRPDLVPAVRRMHMTTVRIARAERRIPPGPVPDRFPTHVIVLADDAGHRDLPIWLLGRDSHRFEHLFEPGPEDPERAGTARARTSDELTDHLLRAAGARVAGVDIDELGPEVTVARIKLAGPAGVRHVTARLPEGLAVAITTGAPIRVADAVMNRLAVPMGQGRPGPVPEHTARDLSPEYRPRYEPRNLAFGDGLDRWLPGGSFMENPVESHWQDYACAAEEGVAALFSTVARPEGFAFLGQQIYADDYRGAVVVFRGQVRNEDTAVRAGLFLRVRTALDVRGPLTVENQLADPANHIVMADNRDWAGREVTARIPDDADAIVFGVFLAGRGRIELRDAELTRPTTT